MRAKFARRGYDPGWLFAFGNLPRNIIFTLPQRSAKMLAIVFSTIELCVPIGFFVVFLKTETTK